MYCPHCGTETTQGLNYCNRCGGNLSLPAAVGAQESRPAVSTGKVWAAGTTTVMFIVMAFGIMFGALDEMARRGLPPDVLKFIILCGTFIILGGIAFFGWLWTRILGLSRRSDDAQRLYQPASHTSELGPARFGALPEAQTYPTSSVTEHTTRTLERQVRNQKSER
jgi:hypothetical protein